MTSTSILDASFTLRHDTTSAITREICMRFMRIAAKILAGIVGLIILAVAGAYGLGSRKLGKHFTVAEAAPSIPSDPASIERGHHFATAISKCVMCHGDHLSGQLFGDDRVMGTLWSANLTNGKGARGAMLTDAQIVNAIRHGVSADGRSLFIMPTKIYNQLSDEDVADIVAYIRSVPPVDSARPATKPGPLLHILVGSLAGAMQSATGVDHDARRPPAPTPGPTAEYGSYLVVVGGCKFCHGQGLSGGPLEEGPPGSLPASNLTPEGLKAYDEAKFFLALREGIRPSGVPINPEFMPWKLTKLMTDDEIRAVWKYLQTVPPKPYGNH
jgi:cytochrome c553